MREAVSSPVPVQTLLARPWRHSPYCIGLSTLLTLFYNRLCPNITSISLYSSINYRNKVLFWKSQHPRRGGSRRMLMLLNTGRNLWYWRDNSLLCCCWKQVWSICVYRKHALSRTFKFHDERPVKSVSWVYSRV